MRRPDAIVLAAFLLVVLLGGTDQVAVRFSNRELPPFFGAGIRFVAAALLLHALAWEKDSSSVHRLTRDASALSLRSLLCVRPDLAPQSQGRLGDRLRRLALIPTTKVEYMVVFMGEYLVAYLVGLRREVRLRLEGYL